MIAALRLGGVLFPVWIGKIRVHMARQVIRTPDLPNICVDRGAAQLAFTNFAAERAFSARRFWPKTLG